MGCEKHSVIIIYLFAIIIRFTFLWIKTTLLLIIFNFTYIYFPIDFTFCLLKTRNNIFKFKQESIYNDAGTLKKSDKNDFL